MTAPKNDELDREGRMALAQAIEMGEMEPTDELPIIGTVEVPGSHFNYLRRGMRALEEKERKAAERKRKAAEKKRK